MILDYSRCRLELYAHQKVGIEALVKWDDTKTGRIIGGCFFNTDEMGSGKTCQVICASQFLFFRGEISTVIVVCPASVRAVWADPEMGELAKHLWHGTPAIVTEYHSRKREWFWMNERETKAPVNALRFIITNYDFIRNPARLNDLLPATGPKTILVLDESSAIKNSKAIQTKACWALRQRCKRVVELNGTPISNSPADLYSQAAMMDKRILDCKTWFHFRARYAVMGGWMQKEITGWRDLEDIQRRMAPYVLRRTKADCLDLPPKLPATTLTATLSNDTWKLYKKMRDDMVAWLDTQTVAYAPQAGVKAMRLAQITSGFLGGLMDPGLEEEFELEDGDHDLLQNARRLPPQEVGREKFDVVMAWLEELLIAEPDLKLLVWCRFRPELARLVAEIIKIHPHVNVAQIHGGQKPTDRALALRLLDPRTMPRDPVIVCGTPASGALGLNLTGAHNVIYISNDYSLKTRMQSEDRVHRPGQTFPVSYVDVVAVGPAGQKTIDHAVLRALRDKENLATLTVSAWKKVLVEE